MNPNQHQYPFFPTFWCWDTEDVEGWLVEEGIGYFDSSGIFHYGIDPNEIEDDDYPPNADDDLPNISDLDEEP